MFAQALESGGVAVVTGAASGIGYVAAERFAQAGLAVVMADLDDASLSEACAGLQRDVPQNARITSHAVDVSDPAAMAGLADAAFGLGPVAILMNNAGVAAPTSLWDQPENWRRMIEVNLFGVLNGIQAFLPRMVDAATPAAVINTGSKQGITTPPGNPGYNTSKAAVKTMTEMLAYELREAGVPISAHLFVPGFTWTGMISRFMPEKPPAAWTAAQTVDYMLERAQRGDFYILCPDNDVSEARDAKRVSWSLQDIVQNRPALSRWHPDFKDAFAAFEAED